MKHYFILTFTIISLVSCNEEKGPGFTVSGTIKNRAAKKIYLEETLITTFQKVPKDSAIIGTNGKFLLKTEAKQEGMYNLRLDDEIYPFVSLVNDAAKITVDSDFKNEQDFYSVSGSVASQSIKDYLTNSGEKMRELYELRKRIDSLKKEEVAEIEQAEILKNKIVTELKNYTQVSIQKSKSPALAIFILSTYQGMANNPNFGLDPFSNESLLVLLNEMTDKFPGRTDIVSIRNSIETQISKAGWVGKQAPEISLPDTEGNHLTLSSFRGKYVLVDFWASWCGPCRLENPNVVDAFKKFRNKNFTILGVSLDSKKEAWKKAIVADNLNWAHISDLKQWNSEVVPLYGIQGIPFNVLVDPAGKIVAENLRGSYLQNKLSEILK